MAIRTCACAFLLVACGAASAGAFQGRSDGQTETASSGAAATSIPDQSGNSDEATGGVAQRGWALGNAPREWFGQDVSWGRWSRATGDWALRRTRLELAGVDFGFSHTVDLSDLQGRQGSAVIGRGLFDVNATLDLETLVGVRGGSFFAQYYRNDGGDGAGLVGDAQGYSNIDADRFSRGGELWYEQRFGEQVRIKVGRVDANSEFTFVDNGGEFLNASMGFSPTAFVLPTYPQPAYGANVFLTPGSHFYMGAGVYNGDDPETARMTRWSTRFIISEVGATWALGDDSRPGRMAVGLWTHDGKFERFDGGLNQGTAGAFVVWDQVWWSTPIDGGARQVATFLQYGQADSALAEMDRHLGGGVAWTGALPGREGDTLGVGATWVRFSPWIVEPDGAGSELSLEGFYQYQLTGWLNVKPDVQFIRGLRGDSGRRRVLVATVRLGITY